MQLSIFVEQAQQLPTLTGIKDAVKNKKCKVYMCIYNVKLLPVPLFSATDGFSLSNPWPSKFKHNNCSIMKVADS